MSTGDRDRCCGLAVLDLDDFKSVNDTLGHPVGDGLIYAIAERLAAFAGDTVKVSRFGGDEFQCTAATRPEAADLDRLAGKGGEPLRDRVDQAVAYRMPQRIVDALEVVEIDHGEAAERSRSPVDMVSATSSWK